MDRIYRIYRIYRIRSKPAFLVLFESCQSC